VRKRKNKHDIGVSLVMSIYYNLSNNIKANSAWKIAKYNYRKIRERRAGQRSPDSYLAISEKLCNRNNQQSLPYPDTPGSAHKMQGVM